MRSCKDSKLHLFQAPTLICVWCGLTAEEIYRRSHAEHDLDVTKVIRT